MFRYALILFLIFNSTLFSQTPLKDEVLPDRVLIKIKHSLPSSALKELGHPVELRSVFKKPPRGWRHGQAAEELGLDRWLLVRFAQGRQDIEEQVASFRKLEWVEICELDVRGGVGGTYPNDPEFNTQYALQTGKLNAPEAWDVLTDSTHVVAVIDTGVELNHADLIDNLWKNPGEIPNNGQDDDQNGFIDDVVGWDFTENDNQPDDDYGHGIHVSGILGAKTNNNLQVAGVCWSVPIMVVRILDANGYAPQSQAAAGIVYAADNGASVLNNSWGYLTGTQVLLDAIKYSAALDNVIVACAHNQGSTHKIYPAAFDEVMGIIATDQNDNKPSWSNYGPWCDMAAPGQDILSLWKNNSTTLGWGTSMATPHVAGAAALIREVNPSLDAKSIRWILNHTSVDLGAAGFDIIFGWGRLDLAAAIKKAQSLTPSNIEIPAKGNTINFIMDAGLTNAYRSYLLFGSVTGINPGLALPQGGLLPLNWDLFTNVAISMVNTPIFTNFSGVLDASGNSFAQFNTTGLIPPGFIGTKIYFAYALSSPWDYASNSVKITGGSLRELTF